MNTALPTTQSRSIKRTLTLGFAVVLTLLAILLAVAANSIANIQQRLNRIVENHNVKTALVTQMRSAARDRTISMFRMVTLADPFERDSEFMRFNHFGALFAETRSHLLVMELDDREKEILAAQGKLTGQTVSLQEQVVDLARMDRLQQANDLLYAETIPMQDQVFVYLANLEDHQSAATLRANEEARSEYEHARAITFIFGGMAFLIGLAVASITIRHTERNESRLFREKQRAQVTLHSIGEGVITANKDGRVEYLNAAAEQLTGWSSTLAHGKALNNVFHVRDEAGIEAAENPLELALRQKRVVSSLNTQVLRREDGQQFAVEYTAAPIRDHEQNVLGAVLVFRNMTELREMAREMAHQAAHDKLTGLFNRQEFEKRLELALTGARDGNNHVLLYMDLDQFKVINDTCGHTAGDELVKQVAALLKTKTRKADTLARLGGDEFGLLLAGCTLENALPVANALRDVIADFCFDWHGKSFEVSASIGVVAIDPETGTITDVLSAADSACYVAKDLGRNRIHVFQQDDSALTKRQGEMQWLPRIRQALHESKFCLYHQLIVPLAPNNKEQHHEILLRLRDAENRIVPPGAFIPAAERYNLMPSIDRWVIEATFNYLSTHPELVQSTEHIWAINLSGQTITDDRLLSFITEQFRRTSVPPQNICFEITETTAVSNLQQASHLISTLKGLGCQFALDDFGAGLSSFNYLKHLHVDFLKIDGGFVKDMINNPMDQAMVESINQLGQLLGLRTIAEFVENDSIRERLRTLRVDYAQGFGIHKPEPIETWTTVPITESGSSRAAAG